MYEGIHHVSLLVTDLEQAKAFYSEKLQFEEDDQRPNFNIPGVWYHVGSMQIHLIVHPDGKARRGTTQIDGRDGHFAIRISGDMNELLQKLNRNGIPYLDRPNNLTGWHQVYICDPDGNIIEFQGVPA
jgi:catechol 2,3-dioxygenase-like lactoylglutathione lyase family enzyme